MGMDYTGACTAEFEASFVSMDADGFTIFRNRSPLTVGAAPIFYLALKGGQHDVGFFTQPTATITGIGFQPQGLFMTSFNRVASVAIAAQGEISIGAAQSIANQGTIWAESRAALNTDANMITYTDSAYVAATGPSPGTTNARANFVQFNSDSFTLNWTTNDGTARQILYWTVGPNVARSGPQPQIQPVNLDWREVYP
jgi:hypothetical protein